MDNFEVPQVYDRVTKILSPFSGMQFIDPDVLAKACLRGSEVHEIIETLQDGIPTGVIKESLQPYINSYNVWALGKKFIDSPPRLYDEHLLITGKLDCIYEGPEGLILVDFKTSASEGKTWKYQGSAYSYMLRDKYEIKSIEFVQLSKAGRPARSYWYKEDMDHFKILLAVYREFFKSNQFDLGDI